MKAEIKKEWLAALRSGTIKQAQKQLRKGNAMCCLGVLCNIAAEHGVGEWDGVNFLIKKDGLVVDFHDQVLPRTVAEWAGFNEDNPLIDAKYGLRVSTFNDGSVEHNIEPHTFQEIADLIEAHL